MANYEFTVVSNEFNTKNNEEVASVFEDLGFEEVYSRENFVFVGSEGQQAWSDDFCVVNEKATGKIIGDYYTYNSMYADLQEFLNSKISDITDEEFAKMSAEELEAKQPNTEDYEEVPLDDYIQDMLLDGEAFVLKEVGNEKLRYNIGCALIITKNKVEFIDLDNKIRDFLKAEGLEGAI